MEPALHSYEKATLRGSHHLFINFLMSDINVYIYTQATAAAKPESKKSDFRPSRTAPQVPGTRYTI